MFRTLTRQAAALLALLAGTVSVLSQDWSGLRKQAEDAALFIEVEYRQRAPEAARELEHGSGFVIAPDGHAMTASHVIPKEEEVADLRIHVVRGEDRSRRWPARLIRRDEQHDLAIIRIVGTDEWKPLCFGDSSQLQPEQGLYAPVYVHSEGPKFSPVSGRLLSLSPEESGRLRTDLPIAPGNSGGAVLDSSGYVIGVVWGDKEQTAGHKQIIPEQYSQPLRVGTASCDRSLSGFAWLRATARQWWTVLSEETRNIALGVIASAIFAGMVSAASRARRLLAGSLLAHTGPPTGGITTDPASSPKQARSARAYLALTAALVFAFFAVVASYFLTDTGVCSDKALSAARNEPSIQGLRLAAERCRHTATGRRIARDLEQTEKDELAMANKAGKRAAYEAFVARWGNRPSSSIAEQAITKLALDDPAKDALASVQLQRLFRRKDRAAILAFVKAFPDIARMEASQLAELGVLYVKLGRSARTAFVWRDTQDPNESAFADCETDCPEMVAIPEGTLLIGPNIHPWDFSKQSERPSFAVHIAFPFSVGRTEVTFAEYEGCVKQGKCPPIASDSGFGRMQRPVINITWNEAQLYAQWLRDTTGMPYRLPTEAEWEYMARAGSPSLYTFGDDPRHLCAYANGADLSVQDLPSLRNIPKAPCSDESGAQSVPARSKKPNAFGIHDVHGNVSEWVQDCWSPVYSHAIASGKAVTDTVHSDCTMRVVRGGSWRNGPTGLRLSFRQPAIARSRQDDVGFRVARDIR